MQKPTFFISSTIYDFHDLRSAIKFYLEEQGCVVHASEFNDFPKPLDRHSYDACLQTITSADYFILLVGARVGGWYEEEVGISITQKEYRTAYELQRQGKLKLLSFVRSDIWQLKEDRRELARYLEKTNIDPGLQKAIAGHPTKVASDSEFIGNFLKEIGKNVETTEAVKGKQTFPIGNWIHTFSGFREVIDVLRAQVFSGKPADDAINRKLLMRELEAYLSLLLQKNTSTNTLIAPFATIANFVTKYKSNISPALQGEVVIERGDWDGLVILVVSMSGKRLHPAMLLKVLESPTFLEFDLSIDSYKEMPIYEGLWRLSEEIKVFSLNASSDLLKLVFSKAQPRTARVRVATHELMHILHFLSRGSNIIALASACARHLGGRAFVMPILHPDNPIEAHQISLAQEHISRKDVRNYLEE